MTEESHGTFSADMLEALPDTLSGRSTPSSRDVPVAAGFLRVLSTIPLMCRTIYNPTSLIDNYASTRSASEIAEMHTALANKDEEKISAFVFRAVYSECMDRFMKYFKVGAGDYTGVTVGDSGIYGANDFLNDKRGSVFYNIDLLQVKQLLSHSASQIVTMGISILQKLGMSSKICNLAYKYPELMYETHVRVLEHDGVTVTSSLGLPLLIALCMVYEAYDNVDIYIYGDNLIAAASGTESEDPEQIARALGIPGAFKELEGTLVDHCEAVNVSENTDEIDMVLIPSSASIDDMKQEIVRLANEPGDNLVEIKGVAMKLAHLCHATNEHIDVYDGLQTVINVQPDYTKLSGCYMNNKETHTRARERMHWAVNRKLEDAIRDHFSMQVFQDNRAYMQVVLKLLQRKLRRQVRHALDEVPNAADNPISQNRTMASLIRSIGNYDDSPGDTGNHDIGW